MRKTKLSFRKEQPNVLKIEKIDFQNGILKNSNDIRFESQQQSEETEPTPTLKQIVEYHKNSKQTFLRFYAYPLERLPKEVCDLNHLQGLSILHCQLRRLPPYLAALTRLRHLFLINNRLTELPNEIVSLKHLEYLDVSENQLMSLPIHFEYLVKLTDLYLDKNRFTEFPNAIALLKKLVRLGLSSNQLTQLPDIVYEWNKLTRLNLEDNRLTHLPAGFTQLSKLEWLNLSGNPLTFIPQPLLKMPKLELLFLRNCGLIDLPKELAQIKTLQVLDISGNAFYGGKIPSVVFQLPLLEELIVMDCGLQAISEDAFLPMKHLCIIRLQNNKIRYISRRLARMKQAEEFNFSGNPLEYVAPEMYQLPLLQRLILTETPFENVDIKKTSNPILNEANLETFEPEVNDIRDKYALEKRRSFM
jgi:Leucine-rich repeat (LRR) protein